METLDVTKIEPRRKHPTIFERFDALAGGEGFVIHNDHDPKPLYYQMIAERGRTFDWAYLLEGPEVWEVMITKLAQEETAPTIGELVAADFRKAEVFRKFGLDFCCGGKRSVAAACHKQGIDPREVQSALDELETRPAGRHHDYNNWELDFLADYIVATHHKYVAGALPMLSELTAKVARVHGDRRPETVEIARYFALLANELQAHMYKEERILFPYVKELVAARRQGVPPRESGFGSILHPIQMMEAEHESAGGALTEIARLSDNFTPPEDACTSYRVLYAKLQEFEQDLHQHIHLENNILFPKAVEMEKAMS